MSRIQKIILAALAIAACGLISVIGLAAVQTYRSQSMQPPAATFTASPAKPIPLPAIWTPTAGSTPNLNYPYVATLPIQTNTPRVKATVSGNGVPVTTALIDGLWLQYWYVRRMYATVYSPCEAGPDQCVWSTSSGLTPGKGVVAVDEALYSDLQRQQIYIPRYGMAVIGDTGNGRMAQKTLGISRFRWIDLGFNDNNLDPSLTGWVQVYFLAPAPGAIPEVLK